MVVATLVNVEEVLEAEVIVAGAVVLLDGLEANARPASRCAPLEVPAITASAGKDARVAHHCVPDDSASAAEEAVGRIPVGKRSGVILGDNLGCDHGGPGDECK